MDKKKQLSFWDKKLLSLNFTIISAFLGIETAILSFFTLDDLIRKIIFFITLILILFVYVITYFYNKNMTKKEIVINNNIVKIIFGDIFQQEGIKVIAFNEYFDTLVDNSIIDASSLNGQAINKYINNIKTFDNNISNDENCKNNIIENNYTRVSGKKTKYKLGTCYRDNNFIAVAFTKFDDSNKAYLNLIDYLPCLVNFWKQLEKVYIDGFDIIIPLLGTGKTRSDFLQRISYQEIINIMLKMLEFSDVKFSHNTSIIFVLPQDIKNEISLYKVR